MKHPGYVIAWDGPYSSIERAGPGDKGASFAKCKAELAAWLRDGIAMRRQALKLLRASTKASVDAKAWL
jgi:hypothetical protein